MTEEALIVRPRGPLVAQREALRQRLEVHRERFEAARRRIRATLAWRPRDAIREQPMLWMVGGLAVGFVVARIFTSRA